MELTAEEAVLPSHLDGHHLTDIGNGKRLLKLFGGDYKWVEETDQWYHWDSVAWCPVSKIAIESIAKGIVEIITKREVPNEE